MKTAKRVIAIVLTMAAVLAYFALPASAKNVCSEISGSASLYGGGKATAFTVKTGNKKSHSLTITMTKGRLGVGESGGGFLSVKPHNIYGYYEIIVKANNKQLSKVNVKNESKYTLKLSGYTEYEVRIYNWKTSTIASYRGGFVNRITGRDESAYAEWEKIPTWKISKTNGISYCY